MESLLKNKLFWACIGLLMFNMFVFVVGKAVVAKAADEVIERLEKDYSPSPYGPGFNPDKANPEALRQDKLYYEIKKTISGVKESPILQVANATEWRENWERERGFSQ
jgi:hypothetical protein